MQLADFIRQHSEAIASEWETFARSCEPAAVTMNVSQLRNHILPLLRFVAQDMESAQTPLEQSEKSRGRQKIHENESEAEKHAALRVIDGFTADQVVAEFRALRASILRLWMALNPGYKVDLSEVVRFNEAIDQMLSESIVRHAALEASARERAKRRDAFLATLSHELRNPLSALSNAVSVVVQIGSPDARLNSAHQIMSRQRRHLKRLVDDLLDLARISSNRIALVPQLADLRDCVKDAVDANATGLKDKGQTLKLAIPDGPVMGRVDVTRIVQVISNILNNAGKFSPPGSTIELSLRRNDDSAIVEISDDGEGIDALQLQDLFVEFSSNHERNLGKIGLGIGLNIAHKMIELHGGTLTAMSDGKGKGAKFRAVIPLGANY